MTLILLVPWAASMFLLRRRLLRRFIANEIGVFAIACGIGLLWATLPVYLVILGQLELAPGLLFATVFFAIDSIGTLVGSARYRRTHR